jgi:hypothetical protein
MCSITERPPLATGSLTARNWFRIAAVLGLLTATTAPAAEPFRALVDRLPRTANAIVILNMEKAKNSELGKSEGWSQRVDKAFDAGLSRVPPMATRFVLAAELDFTTMQPAWEAAVMDLAQPLSADDIIKQRRGVKDTIEDLPAIATVNNVYIVQFAPTTIGAMGPANRKTVIRWIRDVQGPSRRPLSPYLEKAAGYSDTAGTEIILAIELEGAFLPQAVGRFVAANAEALREAKADAQAVTSLLAGIQGVRVGIRIGEKPSGAVAVDFAQPVTIPAALGQHLLLTALAGGGMKIDDFETWTPAVRDSTISLSGSLSLGGLRRLLSVVDSPAASESRPAPASVSSAADPTSVMLAATLDQYRSVQSLLKDLHEHMQDLKSLSQSVVWFDKYAKKIENLPILNVDEEMLNYSAYVARAVRDCAGAVRTMGIRGGARKAQTFGSTAPYSVSGYGFGSYGAYGGGVSAWGAQAVYDPLADIKGTHAERLKVKAEEKGIMASDVRTIQDQLNQATADVRRKMTLKYKVEF